MRERMARKYGVPLESGPYLANGSAILFQAGKGQGHTGKISPL